MSENRRVDFLTHTVYIFVSNWVSLYSLLQLNPDMLDASILQRHERLWLLLITLETDGQIMQVV